MNLPRDENYCKHHVPQSGGTGSGGAANSVVACLSNLTIDHASLSRRCAPFLLLIDTPTFRRSGRVFRRTEGTQ